MSVSQTDRRGGDGCDVAGSKDSRHMDVDLLLGRSITGTVIRAVCRNWLNLYLQYYILENNQKYAFQTMNVRYTNLK